MTERFVKAIPFGDMQQGDIARYVGQEPFEVMKDVGWAPGGREFLVKKIKPRNSPEDEYYLHDRSNNLVELLHRPRPKGRTEEQDRQRIAVQIANVREAYGRSDLTLEKRYELIDLQLDLLQECMEIYWLGLPLEPDQK